MTLKIWDVNMTSAPMRTIKVHEQLRSKLCELYESDCIFDKFECSWGCAQMSPSALVPPRMRRLLWRPLPLRSNLALLFRMCSWDSRHVCSGTYDNKLLLWDAFGDGNCTTLESVSNASPTRRTSTLKGKLGLARKDSISGRNFNKKILHHSYHPNHNLIAIGARNSLYIFAAN